MNCSVQNCPGEYEEQAVVHTVRLRGEVIVIDHVPAEVCTVCGGVLLGPETVRRIESLLKTMGQPARRVPLLNLPDPVHVAQCHVWDQGHHAAVAGRLTHSDCFTDGAHTSKDDVCATREEVLYWCPTAVEGLGGTSMKIFDENTRNGPESPGHAEPAFTFLNRSGRFKEQDIRERLESWFLRYPIASQKNWLERFRSEDDQVFHAAFFELLLHELLLCLGCRVEVEAGVVGSTTKPDFLVRDPSGVKWYLEAVTVSGRPSPATKAQQIMESLCDWLNERLPRRDYLLLVFYTGNPSGSLPKRPLLEFLRHKLSSCDYPTILDTSRSRGYQALPHWEYPWGACRIQFRLIPRKESAREDASVRVLDHPNLAKETNLGEMVNRMRDAILEKARKYGRLEAPFVVALNILGWLAEPVMFMLALFGWDDVAHGFSVGPELLKLGMPRRKGVWLEGASSHSKRYTRLSAVVSCSWLTPWDFVDREICLYNNPWADHPYESVLNRLPRRITRQDGVSESLVGSSLLDILGRW